MIYKLVDYLKDNMGAHTNEPIYDEHPDLGTYRSEASQPGCEDYLIINNGEIYAVSVYRPGRFDFVIYDYPKNEKEIKDFLNKNKDALLPLTSKAFQLDYDLSEKLIALNDELLTLENYIGDISNGCPTASLPPDKRSIIDKTQARIIAVRNQCEALKKKMQRNLYPVRQMKEKER